MPVAIPPFVLQDVRLFDGERVFSRASVAVEDGAIAAVGDSRFLAGEDYDLVDGRGHTLLPGLIDSHTHAWGALERVLSRALLFGVTTELEMQCDGDGLVEANRIRTADPPHLAQLRSSGFPVTVPDGHGTEYGFPVPTLDSAEGIGAFVDARITEGADYIKIIYNDDRRGAKTLSRAMLLAAVEASHARSKRVVVHVNSLRSAVTAIECGADVLGHLFSDDIDPGFGAKVAGRRASVIPTLTVMEGAVTGRPSGVGLLSDPRVAPYLTSFDRSQLALDFRSFEAGLGSAPSAAPARRASLEVVRTALNQLLDAGVPILAGTDAPNPGTTHGASLHRELELLVEFGLTPVQALASATSVPARCFGLTDRGRVAAGLRADLLMVRGDPTSDITSTRDIAMVWKAGIALDRPRREAAT